MKKSGLLCRLKPCLLAAAFACSAVPVAAQTSLATRRAPEVRRVPLAPPNAKIEIAPLSASAWNAKVSYASGAVVRGADGNAYRAKSKSVNINPMRASTRSQWKLLAVTKNTTLAVPSRFATMHAALDFAKNARIDGDAILTVQVADGTYRYGTKTVVANHPDGARLHLRGNPRDPSRCKIIWQGSASGIVVNNGHRLGLVRGFELVGQNDARVPPFTFGPRAGVFQSPPGGHFVQGHFGGDAIGAQSGATVTVRNCIVRKWLHGITAWGGSNADIFDTVANNCWDSGLFGYNNSSLWARNCVTNDSSDGDQLGFGIIVEGASSAFLQNCSATGNRIAGFYANDGSCLVMRRCLANRNGVGIQLRAATIEGDVNMVTNNRIAGVQFLASSGGRLFATDASNNVRNFLSEENSVIQLGHGTISTFASVAGFSCKSGGLITGLSNVPPGNIARNAVDFEPYVPPESQYIR